MWINVAWHKVSDIVWNCNEFEINSSSRQWYWLLYFLKLLIFCVYSGVLYLFCWLWICSFELTRRWSINLTHIHQPANTITNLFSPRIFEYRIVKRRRHLSALHIASFTITNLPRGLLLRALLHRHLTFLQVLDFSYFLLTLLHRLFKRQRYCA